MTEGVKLIFWIAAVHILGLACVGVLLLPALRDDSSAPQWSDNEGDDGWGGGSKTPPPRPEAPTGGLPLPDAVPAGVRLRDHDRLGDKLPPRERRTVREPAPQVPARSAERGASGEAAGATPHRRSGVAELHEPHHRRLLVIESLGQRVRVLGGQL